MKRKLLLCTFIISTLLLSACTQNKNVKQENQSVTESTTQSKTENQTNTTQNSNGNTDTTNSSNTNTNTISEESAKEIALTHAGLTADNVTFIECSLDKNDHTPHYNVEFYGNDNMEYDYEIDAYTGEIIEYDHDAEHTTTSLANTEASIPEDQAKQIALDKVTGATDSDLREFKLDIDNNKLIYEGTILYEQTKYEFEIDANSGDILEWDVEHIQS